MPTSNELIFDAYVRQQVNLHRMSTGEAGRMLKLLRESDKELQGMIVAKLETLPPESFTVQRLTAFRNEIRKARASVLKSIGKDLDNALGDVARIEMASSKAILQNAVPIEINFASPSLPTVRELVRSTPFGGDKIKLTLDQWFTGLETADENRIIGAIQSGMASGETIPQITRRVGAAAQMTHHNVEAITRTAVNHASNTARGEFFKENQEVIAALRWTSTLDGRTSAICRARDGEFGPADGTDSTEGVPAPHLSPPSATPPAHPRCRSVKVPILNSDSIADGLPRRPYVTDKRTGKRRQLDFEKDARRNYNAERTAKDPAWGKLPANRKATYRQDVRRAWADKNVGTVPGETTYDQWLRRQDASFQNSVLGTAKGKMYRANPDMTMNSFVDRRGQELTLKELEAISPS